MGVDLNARMIADSQKIHNGELSTGGWPTAFIFTHVDVNVWVSCEALQFGDYQFGPQVLFGAQDLYQDHTETQTVNGIYSDIGVLLNPDTGMPMTGSKIGCSINLADLTIWDKKSSLNRWTASFTNNAGLVCTGELRNVFPDFTFNDLAFTITLNKAGRT